MSKVKHRSGIADRSGASLYSFGQESLYKPIINRRPLLLLWAAKNAPHSRPNANCSNMIAAPRYCRERSRCQSRAGICLNAGVPFSKARESSIVLLAIRALQLLLCLLKVVGLLGIFTGNRA